MKKGFTLIEVLTVVIIVGILAGVALPSYRKVIERSHFTKAQVMAKALHDSCERLIAEYGYEDYATFVNDNNLPSNVKKITRLDIGSNDLLPTGFSLDETNDKKILGAGFDYSLLTTGSCEVKIEKTGAASGLEIIYNGDSFTSCSGDEDLCNIYGLEYTGS